MYLKSIEVHGFKSFAHKLRFEFKGGITGIVGPNGSGKSNVADAVRWVLGEQSAKQLRGSKMEDVIFSGTENRKPLGFAYVAITFDNSDHSLPLDYDEITVARRVYRSGESEYLINGTACLLKDVKEMFFDTGIGKEGYSIIGQGQIDKILNGKPEDRRELFDEAAGIVKYKRRKAATVKNLEAEKQNLLRVTDILNELELRITPLKKQSDKAKRYLDLHEQLKNKDIQMYILDYERLDEELNSMKEKSETAERDLFQAQKEYEASRATLDELEQKIRCHETDVENKKEQLNNDRLKIGQLEGEIKLYEQQIEASRQSEEQLGDRLEQLNLQFAENAKEKEELMKQKTENGVLLEKCKDEKIASEEEIQNIFNIIRELEEELDECNSSVIKMMNEASDIKSEQKKYETMVEQNSIKKAEMNQSLFRLKAAVSEAEEKIDEGKAEYDRLKKEIEEKNEDIKKVRYALHENERLRKIAENDYLSIQNDFHKCNSKISTLKNISERYEGYGQSIKMVMEQKKNNKGIIGVVADIISVDKKYETAVETCLGGNIQNIVTDTENTAKNMVEFLKKNKLGRATFLPLDAITADADYDSRLDDEKGVFGPVSEYVDTKPEYKEVIKYLMGRFILVDNIDNALLLARKYRHTLRIVTLDGEFLNVGGSISGGAFKNKSNLLGRKREIEDLEKELESIRKKLDDTKKKISSFDEEHTKLEEDIEAKDENIRKLQLECNTKEMNYNQIGEILKQRKQSYSDATHDGVELDNEKTKLNMQLVQIEERGIENEKNTQKCKNRIDEINTELEEKKNIRAGLHDKINKLNLDYSGYSQTEGFIDEKIERNNSACEQINEEIRIINDSKSGASETIKTKEQGIVAIREALVNLNNEIDELNKSIGIGEDTKEQLIADRKKASLQREKLSDTRNELEKEQIRLQNKNEKLTAEFTSLNQYMWNEYELTYNRALEQKDDDIPSYSDLKAETKELRQQIKSLGDVNVNSIEEYIEVAERYNTMKEQHDDIIESEKRLTGFIEELDEKMRVQFDEKFKEIKSQYNLVFRELFGGGKGELELVEGEDILDAGINIVAQPPGKTLKSITMLSGGEKALSAIAILFAIQNLKPSPFCLLDEIEAALDDSNVKRFAKYLNKLKEKTQYIVITHRQGTMAAADTLYGITMQEKGISTLVSVDLVEQQIEQQAKQ